MEKLGSHLNTLLIRANYRAVHIHNEASLYVSGTPAHKIQMTQSESFLKHLENVLRFLEKIALKV